MSFKGTKGILKEFFRHKNFYFSYLGRVRKDVFICLQEMDNGLTHPVLNNIMLFVSIDLLKMVLMMDLYSSYLLVSIR